MDAQRSGIPRAALAANVFLVSEDAAEASAPAAGPAPGPVVVGPASTVAGPLGGRRM